MLQTKTQKKFIFAILVFQFFLWVPGSFAQENQNEIGKEKRQFLVTAYYSPKPDQSFYIRGSFEGDVALNGQGTHGADGTEVSVGMIAAPQTYPFGTKVYIPGLGVGEVHDRGGAIVDTEGYDRIDVWMGEGEEGLSRALNWGSRFVEGEVYFDPTQAESGLDYSWVNSSLPQATISQLKAATPLESDETAIVEEPGENLEDKVVIETIKKAPSLSPEVTYLKKNINLLVPGFGKGSEGENVKQLQRMLEEVGYFQADLTGVYDQSTMEAVFLLQKDQGVLAQESDLGAGYFGTKTHQALLNSVDKKVTVLKEYPKEIQVWVPPKQDLPKLNTLSLPDSVPLKNNLDFDAVLLNKKIVQEGER